MIIALVVILAIILLIIFFSVYNRTQEKKYKDFIDKNSVALEIVKEINRKYKYYPYVSFDLFHVYDNRNFFDTISCEDYLIYDLQFNKRKVLEQINRIEYNKKIYLDYKKEVNNSLSFGIYKTNPLKMNIKKLKSMEIEAVNKILWHQPKELTITVDLRFEKDRFGIIGKHQVFSTSKLLELIDRISKKNGNFFLDRNIWESICRVERGKVSNKLRFKVYARDGYRCRCCKRKFESKFLEVDHILPISKGGKSTIDNLQTLCHNCNQAKGTKYIKY